jgi:micrococcal nuclease
VAVNVRLALAALAALLACAPHALAQAWPVGSEITGTVAEVVSGDTLIVAEGARKVTVRLADVVAPQGSEYYAPGARGLLSGMVQGEEVGVKVTGSAGPDSVFGRVVMQKLDVNLEMVKRGAAFVCWDFPVDTYFTPWETAARRQQIGLWNSTWEITARFECQRRPPGPWPARS